MKKPLFFGIHADPPQWLQIVLGALPFVICIIVYMFVSQAYLTDNPSGRLFPSFSQMYKIMYVYAFEPNKRTGEYVLLIDTLASLKRIAIGVSLATLCGLWLGVNTGLFPGFRALALPIIVFVAIIPAMALMPIFLKVFGIGDAFKIALIFTGTAFLIMRDINLATMKIPREQIIKSMTLGSSQLALVYHIIMPQIMPRLIDTARLSLGAAWLFLLASEMIVCSEGLGYRIFLLRRLMAMDVIFPYVLWITAIGFFMDFTLRTINQWLFPWYTRKNN